MNRADATSQELEQEAKAGVVWCGRGPNWDFDSFTNQNENCKCTTRLAGAYCANQQACRFSGPDAHTDLHPRALTDDELNDRNYFQPTITPTCKQCPADMESAEGSLWRSSCSCKDSESGRYFGLSTDEYKRQGEKTAYSIDGGGWKLVRRTKRGDRWHPAEDSLAGTVQYGTHSDDERSDATFSVNFAEYMSDPDTDVLLATGDAEKWLITKAGYLTNAPTAHGNKAAVRRYFDKDWDVVQWDTRSAQGEDQWVSARDMPLVDLTGLKRVQNKVEMMDQEVPDWDSLKEKDLAQMCGVSGDQPCAVTGTTWQYHDYNAILDSNEETKWHSVTDGVTEWLRIDLSRRSMINRVVVHPPNHGSGYYYAKRVDGIQIHVGNTPLITFLSAMDDVMMEMSFGWPMLPGTHKQIRQTNVRGRV